MRDRAFFDTNMLIYLYSNDDEQKKAACRNALQKYEPIISTQVINELCNVFIRKMKLPHDDVGKVVARVVSFFTLEMINMPEIERALQICKQYKFSYFDSLMLASAISCNAKYILTEDMQDGQEIEGVMIKNIFVGGIL